MRLYIDEDSFSAALVGLLKSAGHDLVIPNEFGLRSATDPIQLIKAIVEDRALLTKNHDDFVDLNKLVIACGGHHPGILVIRSDNDPRRDMTERGIASSIGKLDRSGVPIRDAVHVLNHWR